MAPTANHGIQAVTSRAKDDGFDQFSYNRQARLFQGPADGVDRMLDGMVWGDPTSANDHLEMKWSLSASALTLAPVNFRLRHRFG